MVQLAHQTAIGEMAHKWLNWLITIRPKESVQQKEIAIPHTAACLCHLYDIATYQPDDLVPLSDELGNDYLSFRLPLQEV